MMDIIKNIHKIKTELEEHARKLEMGVQLAANGYRVVKV